MTANGLPLQHEASIHWHKQTEPCLAECPAYGASVRYEPPSKPCTECRHTEDLHGIGYKNRCAGYDHDPVYGHEVACTCSTFKEAVACTQGGEHCFCVPGRKFWCGTDRVEELPSLMCCWCLAVEESKPVPGHGPYRVVYSRSDEQENPR